MHDEYLQSVKQKEGLLLDPRTKIIVLLAVNLPAFTANTWFVLALAAALPLTLLYFENRRYISFVLAVLYAVALLVDVHLLNVTQGAVNIILAFLSGIVCRMMPGIIMGYLLLLTTTVSEFVAAMERIYMPRTIIIPFSVMFRFFPTVKEESAAISDAMKMRGIDIFKTRGGLISLMEYRLVPLLISCVKIGDELSSSALTRGLGNPVKRTNICNIGFRAADFACICLSAATVTLFVFGRR